MPRRRQHPPLRVLLNNRFVGYLSKAISGAISFQYAKSWLDWPHAIPVSLSLPLRDDAYRGEPVVAVFDNLLPDSDALRRRIAGKVGASGIDAYSLLSAIGHDCVGALQFVRADEEVSSDNLSITGEAVDDHAIENLLKGLAQAPLGLDQEDAFRISIAGAQEKTALLWHQGRWIKPHGTTPTTHIFKTQIGELPNGIDLSNSVENEYYCLKLASAFGLPVNKADIHIFGATKALVIERFDRRWTKDGRLIRLPQEDCCQALSIPPTKKYQSEGGPSFVQVLELMRGSDNPAADQATIFKAQILFWLMGATDGHAKNFSIFLGSGGTYHLTPLYDLLTVQPNVDSRLIEPKQIRLAMSVGNNRRYKIREIRGRHFIQSAEEARLPRQLVSDVIDEVTTVVADALNKVESELSAEFPMAIHESVSEAVTSRIQRLQMSD